MRPIKATVAKLKRLAGIVFKLNERLDEINFNQGLILSELSKSKGSTQLRDHEFKVFSQWGEDGILQYLLRVVPIVNQTFIEFGVEDFFQSNCRFLMMKDNWRGFVIDGSEENIERLKTSYFFWKHELGALASFITRENINELLSHSGFEEDLGILSIDLDGIDLYVLEAITNFRPRILICEYNAVFGVERKISVPYDPAFVRTARHSSNLYAGASLAALHHVAAMKGYSLVGTNSAGNNAFFVRNDLLGSQLAALDVRQGFTPSRFRESKDAQGLLSHVGDEARIQPIKGLPVYNVETGKLEAL